MPYINQHQRRALRHVTSDWNVMFDAGSLNYMITTLVLNHIEKHGMSYSTINETIGVLECAKLELYRRLAAPYEDQKILQNGDVYPPISSNNQTGETNQ